MSIRGPHGQWVENIHLDPYTTEEEFYRELYEKKYSQLLQRANDFVVGTGGTAKDDVLIFIRYVIDVIFKYLSCLPLYSAVDLTHANMNMSQCQGTNVKFLCRSTTVSHRMRVNLPMWSQMEGLSVSSKEDTAIVL